MNLLRNLKIMVNKLKYSYVSIVIKRYELKTMMGSYSLDYFFNPKNKMINI